MNRLKGKFEAYVVSTMEDNQRISLLDNLAISVEKAEEEAIEGKLIDTNPADLCDSLLAILNHELKDKFASFWSVAESFSPKETIQLIYRLNFKQSEKARSEAWTKHSLNEGSISSYFSLISQDLSLQREFYKSAAFVRDSTKMESATNLINFFISSVHFDVKLVEETKAYQEVPQEVVYTPYGSVSSQDFPFAAKKRRSKTNTSHIVDIADPTDSPDGGIDDPVLKNSIDILKDLNTGKNHDTENPKVVKGMQHSKLQDLDVLPRPVENRRVNTLSEPNTDNDKENAANTIIEKLGSDITIQTQMSSDSVPSNMIIRLDEDVTNMVVDAKVNHVEDGTFIGYDEYEEAAVPDINELFEDLSPTSPLYIPNDMEKFAVNNNKQPLVAVSKDSVDSFNNSDDINKTDNINKSDNLNKCADNSTKNTISIDDKNILDSLERTEKEENSLLLNADVNQSSVSPDIVKSQSQGDQLLSNTDKTSFSHLSASLPINTTTKKTVPIKTKKLPESDSESLSRTPAFSTLPLTPVSDTFTPSIVSAFHPVNQRVDGGKTTGSCDDLITTVDSKEALSESCDDLNSCEDTPTKSLVNSSTTTTNDLGKSSDTLLLSPKKKTSGTFLSSEDFADTVSQYENQIMQDDYDVCGVRGAQQLRSIIADSSYDDVPDSFQSDEAYVKQSGSVVQSTSNESLQRGSRGLKQLTLAAETTESFYVPGIHTTEDAGSYGSPDSTHRQSYASSNAFNITGYSDDTESFLSDQSFSILAELGINDDFIGLKEDHFSTPDAFMGFTSNEEISNAVTTCKKLIKEAGGNTQRRKDLITQLVKLRLRQHELQDQSEAASSESSLHMKKILGHRLYKQARVSVKLECDVCDSVMWLLLHTAYICKACGFHCHQSCLKKLDKPCVNNKKLSETRFELEICPEVGLSTQQYRCADCSHRFVFKDGEFGTRLCDYTGLQYCRKCHWGDTLPVPARILHNWDFNPQPVCRQSKHLLSLLSKKAIINLQQVNSSLFNFVEELRDVRTLRGQIITMKQYVTTCRIATEQRLLLILKNRQHFVDGDEMYSLQDLLDVENNTLLDELTRNHALIAKHIKLDCPLCQGKGYICEYCNNDEIIFPFDNHVTNCTCSGTFHRLCYSKETCPRCERNNRKKRIDEVRQPVL